MDNPNAFYTIFEGLKTFFGFNKRIELEDYLEFNCLTANRCEVLRKNRFLFEEKKRICVTCRKIKNINEYGPNGYVYVSHECKKCAYQRMKVYRKKISQTISKKKKTEEANLKKCKIKEDARRQIARAQIELSERQSFALTGTELSGAV